MVEPLFFAAIGSDTAVGSKFVLSGPDAKHAVSVRRMVVGEAIAGCAVHTVQLQFVTKCGRGHEAFEFCRAHLLHVHELHVPCYHRHNGIDDIIRVAQPAQHFCCHFCSQSVVPIKADASPRFVIDGARGRLSDVVQQHG